MAKSSKKKAVKKWHGLPKLAIAAPVVLIAGIFFVGILVFQSKNKTEVPSSKSNEYERSYYSVSNWSNETVRNFFDNCVYSAQRPGSGVSEEAAKVYCGCLADSLQTIYKGDSELAAEEGKWIKEGFSDKVISAMRSCAEKAQVPFNQ